MHTRLLLSLSTFLVALISCDKTAQDTPQHSNSAKPVASAWEIRNDFATYFQEAKTSGSFLLYDAQQDRYLSYDSARCNTRFSPASTFKIFNSLAALETGAVGDENQVIPWDSVRRTIEEWNRDHTLRSGIQYSVVWLYQELARRIGREQMQAFLDSVEYGNQTIGNKVDEFWLDGSLRISQKEQIDFLRKLHANELPFSQRTIEVVKDIMTLEKTENWTYRGKTGWVLRDSVSVGWFVGYLERNDSVWFFATNIAMDGNRTIKDRQEITRKILKSLRLME